MECALLHPFWSFLWHLCAVFSTSLIPHCFGMETVYVSQGCNFCYVWRRLACPKSSYSWDTFSTVYCWHKWTQAFQIKLQQWYFMLQLPIPCNSPGCSLILIESVCDMLHSVCKWCHIRIIVLSVGASSICTVTAYLLICDP